MNTKDALRTVAFSSDLFAGDRGQAAFDALEAMAARDADVRTLDDAATPESFWRVKPEGPNGAGPTCARMVWVDDQLRSPGHWLSAEEFDGATPDDARAKAAAWVREQGR